MTGDLDAATNQSALRDPMIANLMCEPGLHVRSGLVPSGDQPVYDSSCSMRESTQSKSPVVTLTLQ